MLEFVGIYSSAMLQKELHNHSSWEIIYCLEGSGIFCTETERTHYSAGTVTVIPEKIQHGQTPETNSIDLYIMVNTECPFTDMFSFNDTADGDIKSLMMLLYRLNMETIQGRAEATLSLLDALIALVRTYGTGSKPQTVYRMENELLANVSNPHFTVHEMYERLYMSEDAARDLFKQIIGCSPHEHLNRLRVQQACRMLAWNSETPIKEIARRVGVLDPQYFSRMFKQHTGLSPLAWQIKHAQEQNSINDSMPGVSLKNDDVR